MLAKVKYVGGLPKAATRRARLVGMDGNEEPFQRNLAYLFNDGDIVSIEVSAQMALRRTVKTEVE